jgi:hypothetical protein
MQKVGSQHFQVPVVVSLSVNIVKLCSELFASFQTQVWYVYNEGSNVGLSLSYYQRKISFNIRKIFLMELPFIGGDLNYGIF